MVDSIPEWAIEKARELMLSASDDAAISPERGGMWHAAFARYIAAHEQPPVDPVEQAANQIADQFAESEPCPEQSIGWLWDDRRAVALAALRRGMELATPPTGEQEP